MPKTLITPSNFFSSAQVPARKLPYHRIYARPIPYQRSSAQPKSNQQGILKYLAHQTEPKVHESFGIIKHEYQLLFYNVGT